MIVDKCFKSFNSYKCFIFQAIQARVISKDTMGEWVRFTVHVINIFKKTKDRIYRGEETIWVPSSDLACRCPKVRTQKTYLMIGRDSSSARGGIVLDRSSLVMRWTDRIMVQLKQFVKTQQC